MKVFELMNLLQNAPAGADVRVTENAPCKEAACGPVGGFDIDGPDSTGPGTFYILFADENSYPVARTEDVKTRAK